jgi:predicted metal-dependent hydrolase
MGLPPNNAPRPRPKAGLAMPLRVSQAQRLVNFSPHERFGLMNFCQQVMVDSMHSKQQRVTAWTARHHGQSREAHYLGFLDCFNAGFFYEAHEVLEKLWLRERGGVDDHFYKALIQLAGAFVHLEKGRPKPAMALLRLASAYLTAYPQRHQGMDLTALLWEIDRCLREVTGGAPRVSPPKLTVAAEKG